MIKENLISVDLTEWWKELEPQWKKAFSQVCFQKENVVEFPAENELSDIWMAGTAIRFAGPKAAHPNMDFELTNLSGLSLMKHLEIIIVTYQKIEHLDELAQFHKLKSLFVQENELNNINGIKDLTQLEDLYINNNNVKSLSPVCKLINLKTIHCQNNKLKNLEGLTEDHADNLRGFYCLPNEELSNKTLLKTERELFIKCKKS